jgi:hypothetical protein
MKGIQFMQRITAVLFTLLSTSTFAQAPDDGSLTYVPVVTQGAGAQAVPIPSLFLIPLGLILAVFGYRAIKNNGSSVLGALLGIAGAAAVVSGGVVVQEAYADQPSIKLSNPAGDTIPVPMDVNFVYENTSGVALRIDSVSFPSGSGSNNAAPTQCAAGVTLQPTETCNIHVCVLPKEYNGSFCNVPS